jgi:DNA-binding transcriptional regulator YiaG
MKAKHEELEALVAVAHRRREVHQQLPEPARRTAIRLRAGLTQGEMADVLGVSRQAIARWEAGERSPSGENLTAYVTLLERLGAEFGDQHGTAWPTDS